MTTTAPCRCLEQAVAALQGSGSLDEAYADYNLAYTRFALGNCDSVLEPARPSRSRSKATARRSTSFGTTHKRAATTSDEFRDGAEGSTIERTALMTITDDRTRWFALYTLCAASLMIVLDATIVNVALPSIRDDLGFTESSLAWVVNAYTLTFGGFLLLGGRLGDLYGQRRLFLFGIALSRSPRSSAGSRRRRAC